jgi:hypothetical protein
MDSANLPRATAVYKEMADLWSDQMAISLRAKRKRVSVRAKWKKVGSGWQPISNTKKTFRANYVASGQLVNSIQVSGSGFNLSVDMASYAQFIIDGRSPMGKAKGGKGIPISTMKDWAKTRKIRPRDMETGQFIPNTAANQKSMRFMMNRKIKHFGIEPYDFTKITKEYVLQEYKPELVKALKKDIEQLIKKKIR